MSYSHCYYTMWLHAQVLQATERLNPLGSMS